MSVIGYLNHKDVEQILDDFDAAGDPYHWVAFKNSDGERYFRLFVDGSPANLMMMFRRFADRDTIATFWSYVDVEVLPS